MRRDDFFAARTPGLQRRPRASTPGSISRSTAVRLRVLRSVPTRVQDIDRQLDLATCSYLAAEAMIDAEAATVTLPGLLRLYRPDFGSRRAQLELLAECRPGDQAAWLRENAARVRVRYSRFDWTIAAGATT